MDYNCFGTVCPVQKRNMKLRQSYLFNHSNGSVIESLALNKDISIGTNGIYKD